MKVTLLLLALAVAGHTVAAHAEGGSHSLYLRARAAANCDCLGTALHLIDRAIARDPANGEYRRLRGELLRDTGYERASVDELERARLSGNGEISRHATSDLYELGIDHHSVPLDLGGESDNAPVPRR